ncbi:NUDIX hydrolase [Microbacterium sp.]|uniref:NUDIX hydrolase n=1 Tax=Microbacterium sp. TaxID=51671 RepID=UPI0028126C3F|nr:NUDIX hydrolase [Microbacterium sp.]
MISDPWITLWSDECLTPDGIVVAPYYVLDPADWISVLAMTADGDAIVVDEYRHGAGIIALGTIGGAVEPGEEPVDAAARELLEETGCRADEIVDLGATWANFGNHTNRVHHFLARGCREVAAQALDETESIAVHRLPLGSLGGRLEQSFHQLTWYKAVAWLASQS